MAGEAVDRDPIADEAARLDQAAEAVAGAAPGDAPVDAGPPAPIDYQAEARGLVDFTADTLGSIFPRTRPILDQATRERLAGAWSPLMRKYGLSLAGIFERWAPEIGAAMVTLPLVLPLAEAIQADRAERAAGNSSTGDPAPAS